MTSDIEESLIGCILLKPPLINELYVSENSFLNTQNKKWLLFFKEFYKEHKNLDIRLMAGTLKSEKEQNELVDYYVRLVDTTSSASLFYEYQEALIDKYKNKQLEEEIKKYTNSNESMEDLVENINKIQNDICIVKQKNKVTPQEMLQMIRNKDKIVTFDRFHRFNEMLKIKLKTVSVIGARPSEGKSALALNLFCDLSKKYKCLYFNMEMTETEVYERMLGIESNLAIKDIVNPQTDYQEKLIEQTANKIYNQKYEVVNGSKSIRSIKNKIIREQRDEHLIVFIDYVGYIVGGQGTNDRERIGNVVRELNNITKDYNCTIFLVAQINRNGSEIPTMQDLKDSGELEQTADTIILIHDDNKEDTSDIKNIWFVIPKCRGNKRNVRIKIVYNKTTQQMMIGE